MPGSRSSATFLMLLLIAACEPAQDETTATMETAAPAAMSAAAELTESDRSAIASASDRWVSAALAGNWEEVSSTYAEDAVLMPPNAETVEGRASVRDYLANFPPLDTISFERVHIDGSGDLAYVHGRYDMTFTMDGQSVQDRGKYIEIWERQADGQWRITRDIFNSDLPAQPGG